MAGGNHRTLKDMKDFMCALGMGAGGVELVTGKFGLMDGITGTLVGLGGVLMQTAM